MSVKGSVKGGSVSGAGSGHGPSTRSGTDRHSMLEYNELINYMPEEVLTEKDLDYFNSCKDDLRLTLLVNKSGVRVRDIRSEFRNYSNCDVDLDRLQLKSWVHFLLVCSKVVELKLDSDPFEDRETLYAFVSDVGRREIHGTTRDMQSLINCTPDDKYGPKANRLRLLTMTAREAFLKGFLDPAEGVPRVDPRVPIQDLGVAAAETLRKVKTFKYRKLTFEEQIAQANKPKLPTITAETTAPLPETQTSDISSVFEWMDQLGSTGITVSSNF